MKLSNLKPAQGSTKVNKRLGRGQGSGLGSTSGRGHKGAKSRSGYSQKKGFEGGQMPLQRRVPKFGFKNINRVEYKAINLDALQLLSDKTNSKVIDLGVLLANGLIAKTDKVKVLGRGELTTALDVRVHAFSTSAKELIEKAGGKAEVSNEVSTANVTTGAKAESSFKNKPTTASEKPAKVVTEKKTIVAEEAPAPKVEEVAAPAAEATPVEEVSIPAEVSTPVEAAVSVTEEAPAVKPKAAKATKGDDLKIIEGIGPKIADLFINAGVDTFAKLAECSFEKMKEILAEGGSRYTMHDPTTWPQQAELARDGKMDELKVLQDRLNAGRE